MNSGSNAVVVTVGVVLGSLLATAAAALTGTPSLPAAPTTAASPTSAPPTTAPPALALPPSTPTTLPPAVSAATAGHDDVEAEDSHPPSPGDNPYGDVAPAVHVPIAPIARERVTVLDGMLRLPGGRFVMGSSNPSVPANERPAHPVTIPAFWIDRTEVPVGAYRVCVEAGRCARPAKASATCTFDAGDAELPVSCVHWRDADAYCRFAGKRLPTETEWEYSARGTLAVAYPWGGSTPTCSNAVTLINDASGLSCVNRPVRVGSHPAGASLFGVQDMSGNVEEWTADWYSESLGPSAAPRAGAAYVLRGGGWLSPPSQSRTTSRNWGSALEAGANVGFRCAKDD